MVSIRLTFTIKWYRASTKYQVNSNKQTFKYQTRSFRSLDIGAWELFGIWDLEIGVLNNT
jgi:hypothetical protein